MYGDVCFPVFEGAQTMLKGARHRTQAVPIPSLEKGISQAESHLAARTVTDVLLLLFFAGCFDY